MSSSYEKYVKHERRKRRRDQKLLSKVDGLDGNDKMRVYKRASKLRKAALDQSKPRRKKKVAVDDWHEHDDEPRERMKKRGNASIEQWVDHVLADERLAREADRDSSNDSLGGLGDDADSAAHAGVVTGIAAGRCRVLIADSEEFEVELPRELAMTQQTDLAVGDGVVFDPPDESTGAPAIVRYVEPRRTLLSRPGPGGSGANRERAIAANVDVVVIVVSAKTPPLRPGMIDRYLIAIERGGARAVICVNKSDLWESDAERDSQLDLVQPYIDLGHAVVTCSAETRSGLDGLRDDLAGQTCVFVGQSGVGKSSLLNSLCPELDLATQEVGRATNKGRHTTTASSMYFLENGTRVIDTPGVRQFGLWKLEPGELRAAFHEFDEHAPGCRYADCSHLREPDCEVRRMVERGVISRRRFEAYARILETLR